MLTREKGIQLLKKHIKKENTVKHCLALEAIMRALALKIKEQRSKSKDKEIINEKEWAMAGLLHDLDYEEIDQKTYYGHGLKTVEILKKEKADLPSSVYQAILAHNADYLGKKYAPKSKMDWAIYTADSLTGLIVATALVRPSKKIADVKVKSIKKKFKQPSFAAGTRREQITLCQEKLGISLDEFFEIGLKAMQKISKDLGL